MRFLALLMSVLLTPGCASILRSRSTPVRFASDPPGATVVVSGSDYSPGGGRAYYETCVTPCELKIHRSNNPVGVTARLDGHQPYSGELSPQSDYYGPIILPLMFDVFLLVPFVVGDLSSGMLMGWPKDVAVTLPAVGAGTVPQVAVTR